MFDSIGTLSLNWDHHHGGSMTTCFRLLPAVLGFVLITSVATYGAEGAQVPKSPATPQSLEAAKELFKTRAVEIRKKCETDSQAWPEEYLGELKKLEDSLTTAGDASGVAAVKAEVARFKESRAIGAESIVLEPDGLATLQQKFRSRSENSEEKRTKLIGELTKDYLVWLKEIRKKLTQEKRLDEAQAVDTDITRVEAGGEPLEGGEIPAEELAEKVLFTSAGDLASAKKIYSDKVAESADQGRRDMKKWPTDYSESLQKLDEELTKNGDLHGVVAVQAEIKRFKAAGTLDDGAIVGEPARLTEMQQKFASVRSDTVTRHEERVERLKQAYVSRLQEIQKKLTIEKRLTDALSVDAEIKRIGEAYVSANTGTTSESAKGSTGGRSVSPTKGLALRYSFDRDEGGKVLDRSGHGRVGKVFGAKWTPNGKVGGAYTFNGSSDYITVPGYKGVLGAQAMSISVWARSDAYNNGGQFVVIWGDPGVRGGAFYTSYNGAQDHCLFGAIGGLNIFGGHAPQADRLWHHVALVADGNLVSLYIDGQHAKTENSSNGINVRSKDDVHIGQCWGGGYLTGAIDEVMIFERALTAAEVSALYKAQGGSQQPVGPRSTAGTPKQTPSSPAPRPKSIPKLTLSPSAGTKLTVAALYKKTAPSVVVVSTPGGSGSGFCVGRGDILLSNAHVVRSADRVTVTTFAYSKNELVRQDDVGASVIYVNQAEDVAVLQLDPGKRNLAPIPVARKSPAAGEKICALGSPGLGGQILTQSISEGIVSAGAREFGGQSWLQHTAAVNPGNSGGPLLNEMGEVVGINTLKAFLDGVSFAIPAEKIREVFTR